MRRIAAVVVLMIYLLVGQVYLTGMVMTNARNECLLRLEQETAAFAGHYYDHAQADSEHLEVLADLLGEIMADHPESLPMYLTGFEKRGTIDLMEVLLPDNRLLTSVGEFDASGVFDFEQEAARGQYVSGRSESVIYKGRPVQRKAVPIRVDEEIVGILYGVIDLTAGVNCDHQYTFDGQAFFLVAEGESGNYLLDTRSDVLGDLSALDPWQARPGYSMETIRSDLRAGKPGMAVIHHPGTGETNMLCYVPVGVNDWMAMISVPESVVLAQAAADRATTMRVLLYTVIGVTAFFAALLLSERRMLKRTALRTELHALLLEAYHDDTHFTRALERIAQACRARTAFLLDGSDPASAILAPAPALSPSAWPEESARAQSELIGFARRHPDGAVADLKRLQKNCPTLMKLMAAQQVKSLALVPVTVLSTGSMRVLGVWGPSRWVDVLQVLEDTGFSVVMTQDNIRHLRRMEQAGVTDALTGCGNRAAFHIRMDEVQQAPSPQLALVYVDVNGLNNMNNLRGHDAGDAMLRDVAAAMSRCLAGAQVFRIGGDEFTAIITGLSRAEVEKQLAALNEAISLQGHSVSLGWAHDSQGGNAGEILRKAEARMYQAKSRYYQNQSRAQSLTLNTAVTRRAVTEHADVDAFLVAAQEHYRAVYIVTLGEESVRAVYMPEFFASVLSSHGGDFFSAFREYVSMLVHRDDQRAVYAFVEPAALSAQLAQGQIPSVTYRRYDGITIRATVRPTAAYSPALQETIWLFEAVDG